MAQAQAILIQNLAAFIQRCADVDSQMAKLDVERNETNRIYSERFARIAAILIEHSRILQTLPDAVRDKIGFKSPDSQPSE